MAGYANPVVAQQTDDDEQRRQDQTRDFVSRMLLGGRGFGGLFDTPEQTQTEQQFMMPTYMMRAQMQQGQQQARRRTPINTRTMM